MSINIANIENLIEETTDEATKEELLKIIDMSKKSQVMKVHPYKITQLSGKDKRWHTYLRIDGKKTEIKKPTEKELINYLCNYYGIGEITFEKLFEEWLEYKKTITESPLTIRRHQEHYNKYLAGSKLNNMTISKITKLTLQSECNQIVKNNNLTKKEWGNLKGVINGMFEFAVDKDYLQENPVERLKITVLFKQEEEKTAETETYVGEEYTDLLNYLDKMFRDTKDLVYPAVAFQLFTGERVGELISLKWKDVDFKNKILSIARQDVNNPYQDEKGKWHEHRVIVEHTKTNHPRKIQLLPEALDVLDNVINTQMEAGLYKSEPNPEDFIFTRNGKHFSERQINYVLEKYAERREKKKVKRSHKLRKTYATRLLEAGVPLVYVSDDLGHIHPSTTEKYIYTEAPDEKVYEEKAKALRPKEKKAS